MDDIRNNLEISNKITDIIKKKRFKWFDYMVHKGNSSYVNHSNKNLQKTQRT